MPFTRGDDVFFDIPIHEPGSTNPYDLRGCHVWVTAKPARDADVPDSEAAWQHSLTVNGAGDVTASDGLALGPGGAEAGVIVEHLTAAESAALSVGGYRWDVQVKDAAGLITTVAKGLDTVEGDITRAT